MYGDRGIFIFPVQLTTSRISNLTRLILTLIYVMTIQSYYCNRNLIYSLFTSRKPPPNTYHIIPVFPYYVLTHIFSIVSLSDNKNDKATRTVTLLYQLCQLFIYILLIVIYYTPIALLLLFLYFLIASCVNNVNN